MISFYVILIKLVSIYNVIDITIIQWQMHVSRIIVSILQNVNFKNYYE